MAVRLRSPAVVLLVLGAALVCWLATVERMRGMDAGPGTSLGGLGWYVGVWVTMMAAMMLPSALPAVSLFSRLRDARFAALFVAGYLLAWTGYGLAAYGVDRLLRARLPAFVSWSDHGSWIAGAALVAAGVYQLTPLKTACLRRCRSPIGLLVRGRGGVAGALGVGLVLGVACVGCCLGLMLALFTLGVMSLAWMVAVGLAIAVEKLAPGGELVARLLAVVLVGLGIWVAFAPASVPALTQPGSGPGPMMQMGG